MCVCVADMPRRQAGIPYCVRESGFACWFGANAVFSCFQNIKIVNIAYYTRYWKELLLRIRKVRRRRGRRRRRRRKSKSLEWRVVKK